MYLPIQNTQSPSWGGAAPSSWHPKHGVSQGPDLRDLPYHPFHLAPSLLTAARHTVQPQALCTGGSFAQAPPLTHAKLLLPLNVPSSVAFIYPMQPV